MAAAPGLCSLTVVTCWLGGAAGGDGQAGEPPFGHPARQPACGAAVGPRRGTGQYRGGARFEKVRAYRFRAEGHCTAWHAGGAYDTVAEVTESDWASELAAAEPAETRGSWEMRHFMIYIDSAGCFEVVAQAWSLVPEERIE